MDRQSVDVSPSGRMPSDMPDPSIYLAVVPHHMATEKVSGVAGVRVAGNTLGSGMLISTP